MKRRINPSVLWLVCVALGYSLFAVPYRLIEPGFAFLFGNAVTRIVLCIGFLSIVVFRSNWVKLSVRDSVVLGLRGLVGVGAFLGDFLGVRNLSLSTHYFLVFVSILFTTTIISVFLLKEKLGKMTVSALCLAVLGLIIAFALESKFVFSVWLLAPVVGGICGSLWQTLEKLVSRKISSAQITAVDFGIVGGAYVLLSLLFQEQWSIPGVSISWLAIYAIAVLIGFIGYATVIGFRSIGAEKGSILLLLQVPISVLIGVVFYKEQLGASIIIGGLLILLAAITANLHTHKKRTKSKTGIIQ